MAFSGPAQAAFGITSFDGSVSNADGTAFTQAGGHPFSASTKLVLNTASDGFGGLLPDESLKNAVVSLPPGLTGNPTATPRCSAADFATNNYTTGQSTAPPNCPNSTVLGIARFEFAVFGNVNPVFVPIYNLVPPPNVPAQFGFEVESSRIRLNGEVRTGGDYGLNIAAINTPQGLALTAAEFNFWGTPADSSHDPFRGTCLNSSEPGVSLGDCPSQGPLLPFVRTPTNCSTGPVTTSINADSWQDPARSVGSSFLSHDNREPPSPVGPTGCNSVPFEPSFAVQPTSSAAESPTGLAVDIHLPQNQNPRGVSEADLKRAVVTLPRGMSVSAAAANGLDACAESQIALTSASPAGCPASSKIGSAEVNSPLLEEPLKGSIYLAKQHENKFGSLLATYIAVEGQGVVVKLAGQVEAAADGQLKATFDDNPQLPFENLHLSFFGGAKAPLINPPSCGTYTTLASFSPWSAVDPDNPTSAEVKSSTSSFNITSGPNGSACPNGSFAPKLEAGTTNPVAGRYSPFVLNLSREDGTQQLSTITAALPKGLLGKLAGIPYCSDSALGGIPSAEGTGAAQLANPSCPAASQLGTVSVGAGAGPSPFYVNTGKVYLAGPYKGAPLSLAIVTPALAGPFDLGNVVVRAALQVNPETTQITAVSDPLPTILHGIPLDLRSVAVNISREGFTLNPTSCNPMEVSSTITGTGGAIAHPSSRFQVASCESLGFAPKLALNLRGATKRAKDPALKAVLTAPSGQANIGKVQVILPKSVFIDQSHVGNPCTRVQFNEGAGNGSACPAKSILGKATAYSPLLEKPLTGNVYFRSNGGERKLPDLVASLGGQIHVNLVGFIDSVHQKGKEGSRVRNTFASVPDAPVSRFVLELQGGRKGLLQNSTNLCKSTNRATVKMDGQNGKVNDFETVVKPACGKKPKAAKPKKK
jgi:hypothetical protein